MKTSTMMLLNLTSNAGTIHSATTTYDVSINENLFFECNFDSDPNFYNQCGGIETKIVPQTSLADLSLLRNELVSSSSPPFSLTDVKSICNIIKLCK